MIRRSHVRWLACASLLASCELSGSSARSDSDESGSSRPESLIELHVVDEETDLPVEGALVRCKELPAPLSDDEGPLSVANDRAREPDEPRLIARTDASGVARLARPAWHAYITVETRDRYAETSLAHDGPPSVAIELVHDSPVDVVVRDERGSPVEGVPVALRYRMRRSSWFDVLRASTSSAGRVTLPHARYAMNRDERWRSSDLEWSIGIDSCLGGVVARPFDRDDSEVVELMLPPTGEVDIVLQDAGGTQLVGDVEVGLVPRPSPFDVPNVERDPMNAFGIGARLEAPIGGEVEVAHDGHARFRFVGLGQRLDVIAARNPASMLQRVETRGPTQFGERTSVTMTFGASTPSFRARVIGLDGRPMRTSEVLVELFSRGSTLAGGRWPRDDEAAFGPILRGGMLGDARVRTDANGFVSVDYLPQQCFGGRPLLLVEHDVGDASHAAAVVELTNAWSPGTHDLGEIRLEPVPLVAAGRTIDDLGEPIANATVEVFADNAKSRIHGTSDRQGRFELRGIAFERRIRLSANSEGHLGGWRADVARGSTDVDVVLPLGCEVFGKLAIPEERTSSDYSVRLFATEQRRGDTVPIGAAIAEDGSFRTATIAVGTYRLVVERSPQGITVFAKDDLVLTRGANLDLGTIDVASEPRR